MSSRTPQIHWLPTKLTISRGGCFGVSLLNFRGRARSICNKNRGWGNGLIFSPLGDVTFFFFNLSNTFALNQHVGVEQFTWCVGYCPTIWGLVLSKEPAVPVNSGGLEGCTGYVSSSWQYPTSEGRHEQHEGWSPLFGISRGWLMNFWWEIQSVKFSCKRCI